MTKRINMDNKLFPDFDKFSLMYIQPIKTTNATPNGEVVLNGYQIIGVHDTGKEFILFTDLKSGKPDECVNLLAKNWLK